MASSDNVDRILAEALALELEERAALADRLLASVEVEHESPLSLEWRSEIRRRQEEIERGEVETIPVEVVLARMRAIRP